MRCFVLPIFLMKFHSLTCISTSEIPSIIDQAHINFFLVSFGFLNCPLCISNNVSCSSVISKISLNIWPLPCHVEFWSALTILRIILPAHKIRILCNGLHTLISLFSFVLISRLISSKLLVTVSFSTVASIVWLKPLLFQCFISCWLFQCTLHQFLKESYLIMIGVMLKRHLLILEVLVNKNIF